MWANMSSSSKPVFCAIWWLGPPYNRPLPRCVSIRSTTTRSLCTWPPHLQRSLKRLDGGLVVVHEVVRPAAQVPDLHHFVVIRHLAAQHQPPIACMER